MNSLVISVLSGAFGMAYFIYGKRQSKFVPAIAGVLLCVFPFFTENLLVQCVIGAVLLAAPFVIDY